MSTRNAKRRPARGDVQKAAAEQADVIDLRSRTRQPTEDEREPMSEELVLGRNENLMGDEEWMAPLLARGITKEILRDRQVGIEIPRAGTPNGYCYDIPDRGPDRVLRNVKKYTPGATTKKNVHTRGYGGSRLMGVDWLAEADPADDVIWVVEGEADFLRALSAGLFAVTGTSGVGSVPKNGDLEYLRDFRVVLCLDQDKAGRVGAAKWVAALLPIAASVKNIEWPADQGKDLTDFLNNGHTVDELLAMAKAAPTLAATQRPLADLLAIALEKAGTEGRNNTGIWLACQLRDERYSRAVAERFGVEEYVPAVAEMGEGEYAEDEYLRSVEQAYSVEAREPSGLGPSLTVADSPARDITPNDAGNADLLLGMHGEDMRHVREIGRNGTWFAWSGRGWVHGDAAVNDFALDVAAVWSRRARDLMATGDKADAKAGAMLLAHARSSGNDSSLRSMLRQAALRDGVAVPLARFDADPALLPFRNTTVVLGPGGATTRDHAREDYSRTVVDVDYDPAATSPQWSAFLNLFVPGELQPFLQKLAGYSLFGANNERLLVFLMGPSSTGKSTFIELLARALGRGLVSTFNLSLFRDKGQDAPRPDVLAALSRRIIYTSEASTDWKLHADHVKRMTGFDHIQARGMAKDEMVEAIPRFTPWVVTNQPPTIEHADPALWKRLVVVPFTNVVPANVDDVAFRSAFPAAELAGVVAWAVAGWDAYRREGLSERPEAVREATARLQRSLSTLDQFLDECCEFAPVGYEPPGGTLTDHEYTVPAGLLFGAYVAWWSESGLAERDRLAANKFGEMLEARGFVRKSLRDPSRPRTEDHKVRTRVGLRLDGAAVAASGSGAFRFKLGGAG